MLKISCTVEFSRMLEIFLLREILFFLFLAQNDSVLLIFLFSLDVILLAWVFFFSLHCKAIYSHFVHC